MSHLAIINPQLRQFCLKPFAFLNLYPRPPQMHKIFKKFGRQLKYHAVQQISERVFRINHNLKKRSQNLNVKKIA